MELLVAAVVVVVDEIVIVNRDTGLVKCFDFASLHFRSKRSYSFVCFLENKSESLNQTAPLIGVTIWVNSILRRCKSIAAASLHLAAICDRLRPFEASNWCLETMRRSWQYGDFRFYFFASRSSRRADAAISGSWIVIGYIVCRRRKKQKPGRHLRTSEKLVPGGG